MMSRFVELYHEIIENLWNSSFDFLRLNKINAKPTAPVARIPRLTTGKNKKEYSWHAPAMKFIGMK